ncbi:type II restriction endonuclease subunit M [Myxococcus sp. CA033]|uniref:type II restriction endonuclease subunit M n=1 Tax=Myxococcus sp. CA033 TaxID=2741516 RepID=UPI00157A9E49|nr:type II restriction endonuclease subunit M [Myxococcus sp. CA033]NTX41653.1 type II restriction endonuclease subunit M [Myxococcus sp. CA033]
MTVFFRVLAAPVQDKAEALRAAVSSIAAGNDAPNCFEDDADSFARIPGAPFSYWVPLKIRQLFATDQRFEGSERVARTTNNIEDNFRFVRLAWEVPESDAWRPWAKGSTHRFYSDIDFVVAWDSRRRSYRAFLGSVHRPMERPASVDLFERPGITWPLRARDFSPSALPAGAIFSVRSFMLAASEADLPWLLGLSASRVVDYLYKVLLGRFEFPEFVVTAMQRLPLPPSLPLEAKSELAELAVRAWDAARTSQSEVETSSEFVLPPALRSRQPGLSTAEANVELDGVQQRIDEIAARLYGVALAQLAPSTEQHDDTDAALDDAADAAGDALEEALVATNAQEATISWAIGVAFGRFDVGLATGNTELPPRECDPFVRRAWRAPALTDGVRARDVLVDDEGHPADLVRQVERVFDDVAVARVEGLRPIVRNDFFPGHIQTYGRSGRRAPIYWQLATPSTSYSVWLYVHAFSKDTLFRVQNDYAAPKLAHEERRLESLASELRDGATAAQRKQLAAQEALVEELRAFLDEVKRVAPLWKPNLDDGVIINFAPLWRLVPQNKAWQKELKSTWDALADGKYDWAHLAMHLWPERVVPKCAKDRSLAIAHGLEDLFWIEGTDGKWTARKTPTRSVDELVRERTSPAVKSALKSLLEAPAAAGKSGGRRGGGRRKSAAAAEGGDA